MMLVITRKNERKLVTVASRPKILQNNSKLAEKRKRLAGKTGGRMAANF
jgi:hypothetical protein